MTKGRKSSEYKISIMAFMIEAVILCYAIYEGYDAKDLGDIYLGMNFLVVGYAGGRSFVKAKNGESE